jgi:flagellin-like hook-associated protein FlgL
MSEVASGQKSNISAVNYLQGTKLRSDIKTRMSGLKQIDSGLHFINTATNVLEGIQNQLEELKNQLPSLRYAGSATLQSAHTMYKEVIQRVIYTLKDSQFNGKSLFDGSFADSSMADVSHLIPDGASPLSVRYGEGRDEVISIPIPRLLPGDGRRDNPAVTDAFMSLFSVTENAYKALEALEGVRDVAAADRQVVAGVAEPWADAQRRLISEALPEGVNAEQNMVRARVLRLFDRQVRGDLILNYTSPGSARAAKEKAQIATSKVIFSDVDTREIEKAADTIINTINVAAPTVANLAAAINVVTNIFNGRSVNNIQQVLKKYAEFRVNTGVPDQPPLPQHQSRLNATVRTVKSLAAHILNSTFPNIFYAGNLTSHNGLELANVIVHNAIIVIDSVLASLKSRKNSLEHTKAQSQAMIIELPDAADRYLNVDYEKLISSLLQLDRQDKVASLAYCLSEKALNAVLKQLEQAI